METPTLGDGLGKRRRRRKHMGQLPTLVGRRRRKARGLGGRATGCSAAGVKANGRLKKGYRWAKGRKSCAIRAKKR